MPPTPSEAALAALAAASKPPVPTAVPAGKAGDIGPSPGPEFVEIEWTTVGARRRGRARTSGARYAASPGSRPTASPKVVKKA